MSVHQRLWRPISHFLLKWWIEVICMEGQLICPHYNCIVTRTDVHTKERNFTVGIYKGLHIYSWKARVHVCTVRKVFVLLISRTYTLLCACARFWVCVQDSLIFFDLTRAASAEAYLLTLVHIKRICISLKFGTPNIHVALGRGEGGAESVVRVIELWTVSPLRVYHWQLISTLGIGFNCKWSW